MSRSLVTFVALMAGLGLLTQASGQRLDEQAAALVRATEFVDQRPVADRAEREQRRRSRELAAGDDATAEDDARRPDEPVGRPLLETIPGALGEPTARFEDGQLLYELTVIDDEERLRLLDPIYRALPMRGFGVPSGGSAGSPSFDPVSRKYWWQ